jgi:alanine-synthesizing transaminase
MCYTVRMSFEAVDLAPSPLEQLRRVASQRPDYLYLSSSNMTAHGFVFPPDVLRESAAAYWPHRRYEPNPKGDLRAREAIARYYTQRQPPLQTSAENIFVTASTSEAYSLLFALLAAPGDNVLAPIPSYPLFEQLAAMHHVTLRPYQLLLEQALDAQWRIDADSMTKAGDERTRAVLIISPHNPTGHVLQAQTKAELTCLERLSSESGLPIVADEVFCEFPFAVPHVPAVGTLFPDATVFHLNGISKMFALPDLKLGWIALSGPGAGSYLERLELLNDTLLSANSLTQFMLPTLFEHGLPFAAQMRARIQSSLQESIETLNAGGQARAVAPQGGMYLFPEILGWDDEDALLERMLEAGLFAHPGYFYDVEENCHLMLSALLEPKRLREGLERLRRVLAQGR